MLSTDKGIVAVMTRSVRAAAALKNLPPFPQVAAKVANLLANDPISFREIADTLKTDAALSAEVLRLANSPLVDVRYEVTSLLQALALLGVGRIRNLIMTLTLSRFLKLAGDTGAMRLLWRHNLACALAARHFAERLSSNASEAYYAGLFHDIGRLALLVQDPVFYDQALRKGSVLDEEELIHFGVDHCEAGAWVIEKWRLPQPFIEVALHHHRPKPNHSPLTMLVHSSCVVANRLGFSLSQVTDEQVESEPTEELGLSIALLINSLECEYGI